LSKNVVRGRERAKGQMHCKMPTFDYVICRLTSPHLRQQKQQQQQQQQQQSQHNKTQISKNKTSIKQKNILNK